MRNCHAKRARQNRRGFTLIELLLVLIILAILAGMATMAIRNMRQQGFANAARAQIGLFENAIDVYELDVRNYPTTAQGLESLIVQPGDIEDPTMWKGPYLKSSSIPADPWGRPYMYEATTEGVHIYSLGPDGQDGTADDISNQPATNG